MTEAAQIRLHRARSWLRKAGRAHMSGDADAQFMFLWIAFNALYGTPRYQNGVSSGEVDDFKAFLRATEDCRQIEDALNRAEPHTTAILRSPFLNIACWRRWDEREIRDRAARRATPVVFPPKEARIVRVFRQLYTLRNQILHGAATDTGRRNRESLAHAIPVLAACVPALVDFVRDYGDGMPGLQAMPYLPSTGDSAGFNTARLR